MRTHAKDGSLNETMILTMLDRHRYKDLSDNWKRHMKRMFKNIKDNDYIRANYYEYGDAKPDLEIIVNNRKILLSIKSGHSPAMHCEPVKTFYAFLRELGVPERILKILSFYHYGYSDKTGGESNQLTRDEVLDKYPNEIKEVNDYFDKHIEIVHEIIYRTIIKGRLKRDLIDYFYYGNTAKGFLLSVVDIIKLITEIPNPFTHTVCIKQLTYVSCDRSKKNTHHNHVKINWPVLCKWFYDEDFMKKYG